MKFAVLVGCGGFMTAVTGCSALFLTVGQGLLSGFLSSILADFVRGLINGGGDPNS
jgi:hypothetical protein